MNFQVVQQAQGQYVKIMATIVSTTPTKSGKYGLHADISLRDITGIQQSVDIGAGQYDSLIPTQVHQGQQKEFSIKAVNTQQGLKYYGFCSEKAAQPPSQTLQNAPESTNSTQLTPRDLSIAKQAIWKGYCELMSHSQEKFDATQAVLDCWFVFDNFITKDKYTPSELDEEILY